MRNANRFLGLAVLSALGCNSGAKAEVERRVEDASDAPAISVSPDEVVLEVSSTQLFAATVSNLSPAAVTWSATCGTFEDTAANPALYTAPPAIGECVVTATGSDAETRAEAKVTVSAAGTVQGKKSCGSTPSGGVQTRSCYAAPSVPYGSTCSFSTQTRTCNNGAWSPDYPTCTYLSCAVNSAGCLTAHNTNVNTSMTAQSGVFEIEWDVRPDGTGIDAALGLTKGALASALAFATSVRFNVGGSIDCRNGDNYAALASMPYFAGTTYRVRETINVPARSYSVFISHGGGAETTLAQDYSFRSDYPAITDLDNWVIGANAGDLTACLGSIVNAGVSVSISPTSATLGVNATAQFSATVSGDANTAVEWSVVGTGCGAVSSAGLYSAPSSVPAGPCSVKVTSVADTSKSASAAITVTSGGAGDLGPLAAFPGCEGMGCGATAGRGGAVYTVNTLADTTNGGCVAQNGPTGATCSLRDAMSKSGARTIVFSVGGTITLGSPIYSVPSGMTLAGQTAPGGGVQIRGNGTFGLGGSMLWYGGNTIIRYLRIRPGDADNDPVNHQGLTGLASLDSGIADIVIDHNSFEWDSNKAVAWWAAGGVQRNTFSWNIVGECMMPHSTGLLVGNYAMANLDQSSWDAHHNILATIDHRLPQTNIKYGRWINNYVFGYSYAMLVRGGTQFDIVGNVWDGIDAGISPSPSRHEVRWAADITNNAGLPVPGGTAEIYMSNNFGPNNPIGVLDNYTTMFRVSRGENEECTTADTYCSADEVGVVDSQYKAAAPTVPSSLNGWPITVSSLASKADLKTVLTPTVGAHRRLACDGSWVANRDAVDTRVLDYVTNPATSPTDYVSTAGPYPSLATGTACADADGDGMPDVWEDAHGLNKNSAADRNTLRTGAHGYTNLELYLSGLFPNGTALP